MPNLYKLHMLTGPDTRAVMKAENNLQKKHTYLEKVLGWVLKPDFPSYPSAKRGREAT